MLVGRQLKNSLFLNLEWRNCRDCFRSTCNDTGERVFGTRRRTSKLEQLLSAQIDSKFWHRTSKPTPSGQASSRIVGKGNTPVMNFNFDGFLGKVRGEGFWAGADLHSVDLERLS
jgi:hypothetical protein